MQDEPPEIARLVPARQTINRAEARAGAVRVARGAKMGRKPKMTPLQVKETLHRVDAGEPLCEIAQGYRVSHGTLRKGCQKLP